MVENRCLAEDVGPGMDMGSRRVAVRTSVSCAELGSRWCKFCPEAPSPRQQHKEPQGMAVRHACNTFFSTCLRLDCVR